VTELTWPLFFQVLAALLALRSVWNYGSKKWSAPAWGLAGQGAWFCMIVSNGMWGLLISNIPNTLIHARNLVLWRRSIPEPLLIDTDLRTFALLCGAA
jgi:hypothetical protein